jgi:RimJ/RimL family protein N-acetyltransferase
MADQGGPLDLGRSAAKFTRYRSSFDQYSKGRWAVETQAGNFLGYAGLMRVTGDHPLGEHCEIGWRLHKRAWGKGYATEAALAALDDAFAHHDLNQVFAYTASDNVRSQTMMDRLRLRRDAGLDFTAKYDRVGAWRGMVWVADRRMSGEWKIRLADGGIAGSRQI